MMAKSRVAVSCLLFSHPMRIPARNVFPMRHWCILFALALVAATPPLANADTQQVDFERDIRPILFANCVGCHGSDQDEREGELSLDRADDALSDADRRIIVPGKPDESDLMVRITTDDEDELMPPPDSKKKLSAEEIELLRIWIKQGATWPEHWAYRPPERHPVPIVEDSEWSPRWIDRFILARLENEGLRPSPDTDPVTLVRRLHFDLIGLPPTPEQIDHFIADAAGRVSNEPSTTGDAGNPVADLPQFERAYERLVDRLLASKHYGERMAIYWLDLVRYADTVGYHGDQDQSISPYRDYVIESFNDNISFDRFTREQLAGDLLPGSSNDQRIATGYNRLLQTSHEGGVQAKEYLAIYAADRLRNLSSVWMAASLGCCQCHNHKYDPFTMKDFYSLIAFFADVDEDRHFSNGGNSLPTRRDPEAKLLTKTERARIAQLEAQVAETEKELLRLKKEPGADTAELKKKFDRWSHLLKEARSGARLTMITKAIQPRQIRVLPRGNWLDDSGPIVQPAVPEFFAGLDITDRQPTRLDLANWLTDQSNGIGGLTARVFVNRFWYLLLGNGIVPMLDDFGKQGELPTHRELLDNLAVEFIESRWDVKHMMKLIAMSRTYRQSSLEPASLHLRDPYNRLVARQSRFRFPAETVRDNALVISGLLVTEQGGTSVRPYQPAGYYRHLNFPKRTYQHDVDQRQWRRGVYVHWQRQFLHPMLKAFDAPTREECVARRPQSNTPLAALALLNDPSFVEAARVFAERILCDGGESTDARLAFAFHHAVSRVPDARENDLLSKLLASSRKRYESDTKAAGELISTGQAPRAENVDPIELAAWTTVARAILNMNQTITRN